MLSLREYQNQAADFLYEHDRALVLAPVIVEPEGQKQDANQSAVYHGGSGKFEHGGDYKQKRAEVKLRRVRVESLPDR